MRKGRYTTIDNWGVIDTVRPPAWGNFSDTVEPVIVIEACDVREVNGTVWHDGGRRVRLTAGRIEGFRAKTFIGEVAWCDAERYANDWANKAARAAR